MNHLKEQVLQAKNCRKALEILQTSEQTNFDRLFDWGKIQEVVLNLKFVEENYNQMNNSIS